MLSVMLSRHKQALEKLSDQRSDRSEEKDNMCPKIENEVVEGTGHMLSSLRLGPVRR